jgi:hypothetical protein
MGIGGKSEGKSKGNNQSLRPSGFAPAFGRAEAPFGAAFLARVNACPSGAEVPRICGRLVTGPTSEERKAKAKATTTTTKAGPPPSAKDDN